MSEPRADVDFAGLNRIVSPFFALRGQATELREDIHTCWDRLATEHPGWKAQDDARSTCFESLWNITRYAELSLHYLGVHLGSLEFWSHFTGPAPSLGHIEYEFTAYSQCLKTALFHLYFSAIENSHRSFLGALDPTALSRARNYMDVYNALLRTRLQAPQPDLDLLDLLRLIRNTIHNEGVHRPRGAREATVTYRGVEYAFADGKPLDFVKWQFVLDRARDVVALQERVVRHRLLASYAEHIRDAAAERHPRIPA